MLCCVHPTVVVEMHLCSIHLAATALFAFCGQALVPVLLRGLRLPWA